MKILSLKNVIAFLLLYVLLFSRCDEDAGEPCNNEETRCNGEVVEVCDVADEWHSLMDCAEIGLLCCWSAEDETHACLPECEE